VHYSIRLVIKIHRWLDNLLCGMALYQIIHFIVHVAIGHQELWLVEVLFTRVTHNQAYYLIGFLL
jgi:hypothetical protein